MERFIDSSGEEE